MITGGPPLSFSKFAILNRIMPLPAGERLGHYEILDELGRGGMGVVYRARDTRLGREVAVKVSSERFNERFEREARVVASLNHPNICTLYDVGPNYLVMELIEGESPKGPLPLDTVLDYARQMADALDYAHEHGITHRDLKPGNLKVTPDGKLKVLDFGLAKTGPGAKLASSEDSPTLTVGMTELGVILGTAAYMSPEQAKGKPVDKRADIWAFGVVLYELSTGKRLFKGEDISDTLASVLKEEPDFTPVPERLRPLLQSCLQKDPKKRLRDIADALKLVPESLPQPVAANRASWIWPAVAAALVTGLGLGLWNPWRAEPPLPPVSQFEIELPQGLPAPALNVVSPDGRRIALLTQNATESKRLFVRELDSLETRELTQAGMGDGPLVPFWSSDSRWLVYPAADGAIKKIDIRGGPPQPVCANPRRGMVGGAWSVKGEALIGGPRAQGMLRVTPSGCQPLAGIGGLFPAFLPDGRRFTYVENVEGGGLGVFFGSLDAREGESTSEPLIASINNGSGTPNTGYVPSSGPGHGHVLYVQGGDLLARPFDESKGRFAGEATVVAENVASFSASADTLAYTSSAATQTNLGRLTWVDRLGKTLGTVGDPANYTNISLPPDSEWAAVMIRSNTGTRDLYRVDLRNGQQVRLTANLNVTGILEWSNDSKELVYAVSDAGGTTIYRRPALVSGEAEAVVKLTERAEIWSWSSDKRYLLVTVTREKTGQDIDLISLEGGEAKVMPLLREQSNEYRARFSPDGRWIAYMSNESGRPEMYVRSFTPGTADSAPILGEQRQVSKGVLAGTAADWRNDSRVLGYQSPAREIVEVTMIDSSQGRFGEPMIVRPGTAGSILGRLKPDLQGSLSAIREAAPETPANTPQKLVVIENWQSLPQLAR